MAGNGKKVMPLEPAVIKTLLDRLTDDDGFRELFQKDPHAAMAEAGYKALSVPGDCLQLTSGATLASPERIKKERAKLEAVLSLPFSFMCPEGLKAD